MTDSNYSFQSRHFGWSYVINERFGYPFDPTQEGSVDKLYNKLIYLIKKHYNIFFIDDNEVMYDTDRRSPDIKHLIDYLLNQKHISVSSFVLDCIKIDYNRFRIPFIIIGDDGPIEISILVDIRCVSEPEQGTLHLDKPRFVISNRLYEYCKTSDADFTVDEVNGVWGRTIDGKFTPFVTILTPN